MTKLRKQNPLLIYEQNSNGECNRLGHIVMLLFKALALGKIIIIIISPILQVARSNPKLCFGGF
jgi:hypothetical protein